MNGKPNKQYKVGEKVFAKIRGYSPWPAYIESIQENKTSCKYNVIFFGTQETGVCKELDVYEYDKYKELNIAQKNNLNSDMLNALNEAELYVTNDNTAEEHIPFGSEMAPMTEELMHDEVIESAQNIYAVLSRISQKFSSDAIESIIPEITMLLNKFDEALKFKDILTEELKETLAERDLMKKSLEGVKHIHKVDLEASISIQEESESVISSLKKQISDLELARKSLAEELKTKDVTVDLLAADRAELSRRLDEMEAKCQTLTSRVIREDLTFQEPKHSSRRKKVDQEQPVFETRNRFSPIASIQSEPSICEPSGVIEVVAQVHQPDNSRTPPVQRIRIPLVSKCPKRKVVILADSHGKNLYHNLMVLFQDFDVFVYTQPGAKLKQVVSAGFSMITDLTERDFIVIVAGTNDIGEYEPSYLTVTQGIRDLLAWKTKANILCLDLPFRHDKPHLNDNIFYANMAIKKMISEYLGSIKIRHLSINDTLKRAHYTRHGLHLGRLGKAALGRLVSDAILNHNTDVKGASLSTSISNNLGTKASTMNLRQQTKPSPPPTDLDAIVPFPAVDNPKIRALTPQPTIQVPCTSYSQSSTPILLNRPSDVNSLLMEEGLFTMSMEDFPPFPASTSSVSKSTSPLICQQQHTSFLEIPAFPLSVK